ncbi:MAG: type VI secretion system tube protein Hcp [Lysobacterales bacterium]
MRSLFKIQWLVVLTLMLLPSTHANADAFVRIEANGSLITGSESASFTQLGVQDFAKLQNYTLGLERSISAGGGPATSQLSLTPVTFIKSLGRSSVLLKQAAAQGQTVTAEIRVFAPNGNTGQQDHVYTLQIINGQIERITPWFEETDSGETYFESVAIVPNGLIVTHVPTGATTQIQAGGQP